MSRSAVGLLSVLLVLPAAASAAVPGTMNFQGRLLDTAKLPRNGLFQMTFRVCDSLAGSCAGTCQAGNPCLWSEDKNVPVFNGVFAVQLGSSTALDAEIFSSAGRYLEITVAGETMSPREPLASGPYSLRASVSDSLAVGALTDAQVAPAAGIAYSKLALTGSVQNSDLAGSIADSKLNTITAAGKVEPGAIASGSLPATVIASSLAVNSVTNGSQITDGIITNEDLAGSISPSKISGTAAILGANTFTGNQTLSDGVLLDMSGVDNSATTEGFRLPQATDVSAGTAEGQLAWDRDNDLLQIGTGAGIRTIGIPNNITVYNTAGNHTWTRPPGVSMVYVQVWGGGGGGGSGASNQSDGGGGGGGYSAGLVAVTANAAVTVGSGGTSDGGNGGNSSFGGAVTLTANGGLGTTSATGGAGGTASGGTINMTGQKGGNGLAADGAGSGNGGASPFGGAGGMGQTGANASEVATAGEAGQQPGGGGGGGKGAGAGGAGAPGMVIVMY